MLKNMKMASKLMLGIGATFLISLAVVIGTYGNLAAARSLLEADAEAAALLDLSMRSLTIGLTAAMAVGLVLSAAVNRRLINRLGQITSAASGISRGQVEIGRLDTGADEIGILAESLNALVQANRDQVRCIKAVALGDLSENLDLRSEDDQLGAGINEMLTTLRRMTEDMETLIESTKNGDLKARMDTDKYAGDWSLFIRRVNQFIEVIEKPITFVSDYIETMADGKALREIVPESQAAYAYEDPLTGETFTAVRNTYQGEFKRLMESLSKVRTALYAMLGEAGELNHQMCLGNLSHRADVGVLVGGWQAIMAGFNGAVDMIVNPVEEASTVLQHMSEGNLNVRVQGDYIGDHRKIKDASNKMIDKLTGYIREIDMVLNQMSHGNLAVEVKQDYVGDFRQIKTSLDGIVEAFNMTFKEIGITADQVSEGATESSNLAQALSQGATEQAASIEEITAAMHELGEKTKVNAQSAKSARALSIAAAEHAERGNGHMKQMIDAMQNINASSSSISKIISVIDDIAFQTNILALNAAVEAARAGEHGKGFAVVAEEVRNLAARSAGAAKETTEMIKNSIDQVDEGTRIAKTTAEALEQIVTAVSDAADLVRIIADASMEQDLSISEINSGIGEVSTVTQTNSATAQQSAAASEQMSSQAFVLKELVERFKLMNTVKKPVVSEKAVPREVAPVKKAVTGKRDVPRPEKSESKKKHQTETTDKSEPVEKKVTRPVSVKRAPEPKVPMQEIRIDLDDVEFGKYS